MVAIRREHNRNGKVLHNFDGSAAASPGKVVMKRCGKLRASCVRTIRQQSLARRGRAARNLRMWMRDGVMKFGHARTFFNRPRGGTAAPPAENRGPALPCPPARHEPSGRIAGRIRRVALAVLRAMGAASVLRLAGALLGPALHAWRPGEHSAPVPRHASRHRMERALKTYAGLGFLRHARRPAGVGPPHPVIWLGYLERLVMVQGYAKTLKRRKRHVFVSR